MTTTPLTEQQLDQYEAAARNAARIGSGIDPAAVRYAVGGLIAGWQAARAVFAEIERAEHPDITDRHGRVWTWRGRGDTYSHCGNAAPADMINQFGLPSQRALDNPNYDLCDICLNGRVRNVPACKPEWGCSHVMHQGGAVNGGPGA